MAQPSSSFNGGEQKDHLENISDYDLFFFFFFTKIKVQSKYFCSMCDKLIKKNH